DERLPLGIQHFQSQPPIAHRSALRFFTVSARQLAMLAILLAVRTAIARRPQLDLPKLSVPQMPGLAWRHLFEPPQTRLGNHPPGVRLLGIHSAIGRNA